MGSRAGGSSAGKQQLMMMMMMKAHPPRRHRLFQDTTAVPPAQAATQIGHGIPWESVAPAANLSHRQLPHAMQQTGAKASTWIPRQVQGLYKMVCRVAGH